MLEAKRRSLAESENIDLMSHKRRLEAHVMEAGLKFRQMGTGTDDGNCLFHAIADQLLLLGMEPKSHRELRLLAVQALRDQSFGVSLALQYYIYQFYCS